MINVRKNSFFEESKLELWQIIGLTYIWCRSAGSSRGLSYEDVKHELSIGCGETVVDWNQYCRDITVAYFANNPVQLGGPGRIVEIDESLFSRRKYNRGRLIPEQWVFGGYEAATKEGFLIPVQRRDAATLIPIIQQWIRAGTEVWSDMWAAYNNLPAHGYVHGTVNHTYNYVDPVTQVTTNRVEAMWQRSKSKFKAMHGPTNRDMVPDYLSEFMWAQRFNDHRFFHLWDQIATLYPVG